jgi:hypothetical protein
MKLSILTVLFVWVVLVSLCSAQIGAKTQQGKIHGVWQNNDFGYQMTLMLNADGSGEFDGEAIRFTAQGNQLSITADGTITKYNYSLQGNSLNLSGGDLEKAITFTRQGTSSENTSTQTSQPSQKTTTAVSGTIPKNILGAWSGYNEVIEFKPDGQCLYRGQPFHYTVSGNYITLETAQGNIMMAYAVAGNQLNLQINNQNFVYTKNGAATGGAAKTTVAGGGTKLDMSLVGEWCYVNVYSNNSGGSSTSECIRLKNDGTYEYSYESSRSVNTADVSGGTSSQDSDRGTWWVDGNRIHYKSQTKGEGSYELVKKNHPKNNDAMIVLDGRTFVTSYNRPPW